MSVLKILNDNACSHEVVVKVSHGGFTLREMTGTIRDEWDAHLVKALEKEDDIRSVSIKNRTRLVAMCIVETDGRRACDVHGVEAVVAAVGNLPHRDFLKLYTECEQLNFMDAKSLDVTIKNSSSDQSVANGSDSPDNSDARSERLSSVSVPVSS